MDGALYAINAGTIAPVVMVDPGLFARAKVALPDDTSWTWDEMGQIATELTRKLPEGTYGLTDFSGRDAAFRVWIRQQGAETFTDGNLGFDAGVAASFFALAKKLQTAKATPPASQSAEDVSAAVAERLFSTGRTAMAIYSSNQITAFDAATKKDLKLLRLPSVDGTPKGAKVAYQASMYWVITQEWKAAAAARQLVDFLVTDEGAGKILLTERGSRRTRRCLRRSREVSRRRIRRPSPTSTRSHHTSRRPRRSRPRAPRRSRTCSSATGRTCSSGAPPLKPPEPLSSPI